MQIISSPEICGYKDGHFGALSGCIKQIIGLSGGSTVDGVGEGGSGSESKSEEGTTNTSALPKHRIS